MGKRVSTRECKRLMHEILDRQNVYGNVVYPKNTDFLRSAQNNQTSWNALDFLSAKKFICLTIDEGNILVCIHIEDKGVTYFEDIEQHRWEFFSKSIFIPVIVALLTSLLTTGIGYLWTMSGIRTNQNNPTPSIPPITEETN